MKITTMKVTTKMRAGALVPNHNQSTQSLRCKTALKAGPALTVNHNQATSSGLRVKTAVKAGGGGDALTVNHNQSTHGLRSKTSLKAGGVGLNHNQTAKSGLRVKSAVQAGPALTVNHNETVATAPPEIEPSILDTIADSMRVR